MKEETEKTENSKSNRIYYWDEQRPNVGVCVKLRDGKRGPFYSFEPLRSFRIKDGGELKMKYAHDFTEEHAEAFGNVIVWALNYVRANGPVAEDVPSQEASEVPIAAA